MAESARLTKGEQRRQSIVEAAAKILNEEGPAGVTHRKVATRASASLSATTYYFTGLDDLLGQAATLNFGRWVARANRVVETLEESGPPQSVDQAVDVILRACLPEDENLENHYVQLVAATEFPEVHKQYNKSRNLLDEAIEQVLSWMKSSVSAQLVLTIVDGAAVQAISEGRDVRETARERVREFFIRVGAIPLK